MREPDYEIDGWCLDDGEAYHRAAPSTFWIPDLADREGLQPGDLAKLIFTISVDRPDRPESVERMWVLVRERIEGGYLGILNNDPDALAENDEFWSGIELPFSAKHVIDIVGRDEETIAQAAEEPKRRWPTTRESLGKSAPSFRAKEWQTSGAQGNAAPLPIPDWLGRFCYRVLSRFSEWLGARKT